MCWGFEPSEFDLGNGQGWHKHGGSVHSIARPSWSWEGHLTFHSLTCALEIHKQHDPFESTSKSSGHHRSHEAFWHRRTVLIPVYQMCQITPFIKSPQPFRS